MKKSQLLIIIILGVLFNYCTEPYEHDVKNFEETLVVQGMITNEPGPYMVKLSRTIALSDDNPEDYMETGAVVTISDNQGNFETLTETSPGIYETATDGIQGTFGNEYVLKIYTAAGNTYESDPVILKEGPGIDSIYPTAVEYYSLEHNKIIKGVNFNLDTKEWNPDNKQYFRWTIEETWEIDPKWNLIPLDSVDYMYRTGKYRDLKKQSLVTELEEDTGKCWNTVVSGEIVIKSSIGLNANRLSGNVVMHLDEFTTKPYYGYSLLVKQYNINKSVYDFWSMLKENTQENGNIFDNIPFNAKGNINACDDESVTVFGYFGASNVTQKRVHYKSPIKGIQFPDKMADCATKYLGWRHFYGEFTRRWVNVVDFDRENIYFTNQDWCVICRPKATHTSKPDFWIY